MGNDFRNIDFVPAYGCRYARKVRRVPSRGHPSRSKSCLAHNRKYLRKLASEEANSNFSAEKEVMPEPLFHFILSLIDFHSHQIGSCGNLLVGQSKKQEPDLLVPCSKTEIRPRRLPKRERAACLGSTKPSWGPRSAKRPRFRRFRYSRFCSRRDEVCQLLALISLGLRPHPSCEKGREIG